MGTDRSTEVTPQTERQQRRETGKGAGRRETQRLADRQRILVDRETDILCQAETQPQTGRQTDTDTHTHRVTNRNRPTHRQTDGDAHEQTNGETRTTVSSCRFLCLVGDKFFASL